MNQDVRRDVIEFGRCFVYGSICDGVMRRMASVVHAHSLVHALTNFGFAPIQMSQTCHAKHAINWARQQTVVVT